MLDCIPQAAPDGIDGLELLRQGLVVALRSEGPGRFGQRYEDVVQYVEIAIELELGTQVLRRRAHRVDQSRQRRGQVPPNGIGIGLSLPFGLCVRLPFVDSEATEIKRGLRRSRLQSVQIGRYRNRRCTAD